MSFSARGRAPDGVLTIFEVIAEGLPPDKPQDDLINQLIQIEDERDRLDQSELIAMVALLIVVC
jgi:cytochrome P450